ncbi:hypothetical protein [Brachyspira pilosicoli]|uniref:hypothetical protein n=1 Tax=Brachyspira pilosicoli TaxID=52584 RepID=UPI002155D988|nr:hypothetical protein [Brachyspira pilosicoli]
MKKLHILLVAIMLMLIACARPFDSRYYYNKKVDSSKGENIDTTPETPPEAVDPNEDPFLNGDWNRPNYGGYDASKFKTWLFKASFQKDKLPMYTFFDDNNGRIWEANGSDWNNKPAQYYKGIDGENYADSSLMKADITDLTVYKYESENPLYSSSGYLPGRIDRFNFYSINGKAAIVTLKQYLIAVDTYSKFIFAYGEITKVDTVFGGEKVPMGFEAIEKYAEKRPFFEYDPIGYVKDDGSVVLFEHYIKEFVASPTTYEPKIHLEFTNMAKHDAKGQGYSPYLPKKDLESTTLDEITVYAKSLKNISVRSKAGYLNWGSPTYPDNVKLELGYFTYAISAAAYGANSTKKAESIEELYPNGVTGTEAITLDYNKLKIDIASSKTFTSSKIFTIKNIKENGAYIDLASIVYKYNTLKASFLGTYLDTDNFGEGGSGIMAEISAPILKLKYDSKTETFVIDEKASIINNDKTTIAINNYPKNFQLRRGESKDITIGYKWLKGNDTVNGEEFEITYTLNFKSIK